MKKRRSMKRGSSEKLFSRTASSVHPKNLLNSAMPMRGGYRL